MFNAVKYGSAAIGRHNRRIHFFDGFFLFFQWPVYFALSKRHQWVQVIPLHTTRFAGKLAPFSSPVTSFCYCWFCFWVWSENGSRVWIITEASRRAKVSKRWEYFQAPGDRSFIHPEMLRSHQRLIKPLNVEKWTPDQTAVVLFWCFALRLFICSDLELQAKVAQLYLLWKNSF